LKDKADSFVSEGYYASFSDIVRTALRDLISSIHYERIASETMKQYASGKTKALEANKDIDAYIKKHS